MGWSNPYFLIMFSFAAPCNGISPSFQGVPGNHLTAKNKIREMIKTDPSNPSNLPKEYLIMLGLSLHSYYDASSDNLSASKSISSSNR